MKFRMNTHQPDGSSTFTPDHKFDHWDTAQTPEQIEQNGEMWVLHLLDNAKPMSFEELVQATHEYNANFNEPFAPIANIALGLVRLIEDCLVIVEPKFRVHCGLKSSWEPASA